MSNGDAPQTPPYAIPIHTPTTTEEPMSLPIESAFTPIDIARGIFRHKWKAFSFFVTTITLLVVALFVLPKSYKSDAKLYFTVGPESGSNPTSDNNPGGLNIEDPREGMVNSAMDILGSREIAERVVAEIGAERILKGDKSDDKEPSFIGETIGSLANFVKSLIPSDDLSDKEKAVQKLGKSIGLNAEKRSYVVSITAEAKSPKLAQDICNSLVESYRKQHMVIYGPKHSVDALEQSLIDAEEELIGKRTEFTDLKNSAGESSEIQRLVADGRRKTKVIEVADLARRSLELQEQGTFNGNISFDPDADDFEISWVQESNIAPALRPQFETAKRQYMKADKVLSNIKSQEIAIARLQDEIDRLSGQVSDLEKRTKQARFEARLGEELVSSVQIAENPTFVEKPVSPKKGLVIALGLMVAMMGSLAIVFVCEVGDSSLKTTEEVERFLDVPVLVSIPRRSDRSFLYN
jgi:succinoglycan biosynthesis transport protein ExoP